MFFHLYYKELKNLCLSLVDKAGTINQLSLMFKKIYEHCPSLSKERQNYLHSPNHRQIKPQMTEPIHAIQDGKQEKWLPSDS